MSSWEIQVNFIGTSVHSLAFSIEKAQKQSHQEKATSQYASYTISNEMLFEIFFSLEENFFKGIISWKEWIDYFMESFWFGYWINAQDQKTHTYNHS